MRPIYLDFQATTPPRPEVRSAMEPFLSDRFGSPSSFHRHGLRARDALEAARESVAALIHAPRPERVIFTSSGTEANNLAVKGVAYANQSRGRHIVLSATEHPSVTKSVESLSRQGFTATRVPVDAEGLVRPEAVRAALTDETILLAVHHVNHDIGAIEPIRELGELAQEKGIPFFVDAVASGGWLPIDVGELGVQLLSLSPHRFYGPKGVGILYRHPSVPLASLIHGGEQEGGRRAGTENVPAIVGAGVAARLAKDGLAARIEHGEILQRRFWEAFRQEVSHFKLNGPPIGPRRSPHQLSLSIEFVEGEGLMLACDLQGLFLTSGTACVSRSLKIPPVLAAIGLPAPLAQGTILVSWGEETSEADVDDAVALLSRQIAKLRAMSPEWEEGGELKTET